MIDKIAGFNIGANDPVDNRIVLTKEEMKLRGTGAAYPMPDVYFAMCKDDGKLYMYNTSNSADPNIGKFRSIDDEIKPTSLSAEYDEENKELKLFGFGE